ncbi:MAG: hypothetical protein WC340_16945 [Kiritimatiellia bacterium]
MSGENRVTDGFQLNPFTGGYVSDDQAEKFHSKRFGPWAYAAPLEETEKLEILAPRLGYGSYTKDTNNVTFNYDRTGRVLGNAAANAEGKLTHRSMDTLFDYMDAYKKYLNQHDPNYYNLDFRGQTQGASVNPLLQSMTNLSTGKENLIQPASGGKTTWSDPLLDALSKFTVG